MPSGATGPRVRVTYRRSTPGDLAVLVDHRHRMWIAIGRHTEREVVEHDPRYRAWARTRLRSGELVGCIAESPSGSVVASGCIWFRPDQPRPILPSLVSPYILSMYTEPAWRGQGVATRIVRELLQLCKERGFPNVELHAAALARPVYGRLGFERTWEMRLWIDPRIPRRLARTQARALSKKGRRKGLDRGR